MSQHSQSNIKDSEKFSDRNLLPENILSWWDEGYAVEDKEKIYRKQEGSLDHFYLDTLFKEIDKRIFRIVRNRMKPGYAKKVDGMARISVGHLTENQFDEYLTRLQSSVKCSSIKRTKVFIPSCDYRTKLVESITIAEWNGGKIPSLSIKNDWAYVKWVDVDAYQVHRSYAFKFSITHNSYTESLKIRFEYSTEFFREEDKQWVLA